MPHFRPVKVKILVAEQNDFGAVRKLCGCLPGARLADRHRIVGRDPEQAVVRYSFWCCFFMGSCADRRRRRANLRC